ncbi:MAG: DNA polymerase/3'-5' exonuclease PolX [Candidatus Omnitrophica bacterium]|nr:DNA polymerase/3'-5' exonuclease PolX [Candidatus Omnitrophota bacterium]
MKNLEIAKIFRNIAQILEIKNENTFRIRAYERAAQNIESFTGDLEDLIKRDALTEIPGIGKDLSDKIKEFDKTGRIKMFEDLKKSIPAGLLDLLNIPSVGPKTASVLYKKLNIRSIPDLEAAIKRGKLSGIFGIKEKTIENILKGIGIVKKGKERLTLAQATLIAQAFIGELEKLKEVKKISTAGSLRRQKETVRDIDILVISQLPEKVMQAFTKVTLVKDILARGKTKSSVRTIDDVQVDCRVVEQGSFGAALLYFTGSRNFNIKLRQMAIKKGLKINEYGVFSAAKRGGFAKNYGERKDKFVAGHTEEEIFRLLGMPYIDPELREDTGEIELALKSRLPKLLELKDIKGDFHAHSRWSDGGNSILEMAGYAKKLGYSFIAITDHSQSLKIARGLSISDLKKKKREIDKVNNKLGGFRVLFGTEVDIDSKGGLDYPDKTLKEFDVVVAAIHSGFKQSKAQLTKRIIKACQNKYVHIIAHPTGRLWGVREAYEIDFDEILKAAVRTNTHLEINGFPERLDLNDLNVRRAKTAGLKLAIGTDAHTTDQLANMRFGVSVARRGWLTKKDVINTLSVDELLKIIKK